ncbi:MAG: aryl-sulfate sulfotransferase [Candidatus Thorarchaeota archaeon]
MNLRRHSAKHILSVMIISLFLLALIPQPQILVGNEVTPESIVRDPIIIPIESDVVIGNVDYSVTNTPDAFDGYNLFMLYEQARTTGDTGNLLLIMDMDGNVVAQKQIGLVSNYNCPAKFINPNTILLGTASGAALWHLETDTLQYLGFGGHHEFEYNPNSDTVFTFVRDYENIGGTLYLFDTILEYNLAGSLVWSWDVKNFISEEWWCPLGDMTGSYRDISHSNTIYYDADEDIIYYMSRNTNTFFKLNHTSKEVIWALGEHGDFALYDVQGNPRDNIFFHAHSIEPIDENTFIMFDNDLHNQTDDTTRISRILEVKINETTMTANESWYYQTSTIYWSAGWGDADRLPNGNRLGAWGYPSAPVGGPSSALIEVNEDGDVVWEVDFQYNTNYLYGTYRMERFRYTPIISSPADINSVNSSVKVSWDAWYNFRNKETLPGNYTLYIDEVPSQTGLFNYTKYWRPTTISIDTGPLEYGTYNVTLEIDDGYGNKIADSVNVSAKSFDIIRTGRTSVEKGQTDFLPTWSGATTSELFCNITLNNVTLYDELNWTGQDITLDPALIALGTHQVHFRLYNGSLHVYEDTFWLQVGPMEPPDVTPLQNTEITILWNDPLALSWNISDSTPYSWSILHNDTEVASDTWTETEFTLNWDVPLYPEGTHNITLVAIDLLGQWTKNVTILNITAPPYPIILSAPENATIAWGKENVVFEWETYNADTWQLWRNGTVHASGDATSGLVNHSIVDWVDENWILGRYNLTFQVIKDTYLATHTFWLDILLNPGDPYADFVVSTESEWYLNGDNALDAPDGEDATIYEGYTNGYLTLDMGDNEEIVDGPSDDFTVYASGGEYSVSVTKSLTIDFIYVSTATGTQSFDLSSTGLSEVRYVKITLISGVSVEIDAIEAINYNTPPVDTTPPSLEIYGDWFRIPNGSSTTLTWIASDESPWSYEIYENSTLVISDFWNGSNIHYLFEATSVGMWNVTLVAYDALDNYAVDLVMIEVYEPSTPYLGDVVIIIGVVSLVAVVVVVLVILIKKKK